MAMRPRSFRSMIAAIAFAGALAACNLIAGLGEDFVVDPNAGDGPVTPTEGGTDGRPDGSTDGQQTDAPADNAVGDARFSCVGVDADFCDDFETPTVDPNFGWTSTQRSPTASDAAVAILPEAGIGGSYGLYVSMYESTPGFSTGDFAWLTQSIGGPDPRNNALIDVEFDFRVPERTVDYLATGILAFPNGGAPGEFGVAAYPTNKVSHTGGTPAADAVGPNSAWHHAHIVLERTDASIVKRTAFIDTKLQSSTGGHAVPGAGGTELRLGTFNAGAGVGVNSAFFDNVIIRRK